MSTGITIGFIFLLVGFILLIGNLTGRWASFPYAGFIGMTIGAIIIKVSRED